MTSASRTEMAIHTFMLEQLAWAKLVQAGEWEHGLNWFNLRSGNSNRVGAWRNGARFQLGVRRRTAEGTKHEPRAISVCLILANL
jgi:hypothetical protein